MSQNMSKIGALLKKSLTKIVGRTNVYKQAHFQEA